ncbi:hypothetical protein [Cellulomonas iranensis]|uniref:hypothetical protein n=1 Tax=Cellulomonas iranensis TaxID=76862 RepID=UPI000B3BFBBA|nr:hypothetical protein [Cellulomonas iranensis]UCN16161.1 hypothetical protein LFM56_07635 [Cellulomonas iranensis]
MDARPDDDAGADDAAAAQPAADGVTGPGDDRSPAPPDPADAPPQPTDDEVWASLVARLSDVDVPDEPRGARVVRSAARDEPRDDPDADGAPALPPELSGRDWDGTSQYDAAEADVDDLEHFVPQDPGPVLGGDPLLTLAWTAAAGVPLFLLVVVVAWRDAPPLLVRTAVGLFVAAVAVLVWRMPHRRDPSDDDGAVV